MAWAILRILLRLLSCPVFSLGEKTRRSCKKSCTKIVIQGNSIVILSFLLLAESGLQTNFHTRLTAYKSGIEPGEREKRILRPKNVGLPLINHNLVAAFAETERRDVFWRCLNGTPISGDMDVWIFFKVQHSIIGFWCICFKVMHYLKAS